MFLTEDFNVILL